MGQILSSTKTPTSREERDRAALEQFLLTAKPQNFQQKYQMQLDLLHASERGDPESVLHLLLEKQVNPNRCAGYGGLAALHCATTPWVAQVLLDHGALLQQRGRDVGDTPLHVAVCKNRTDMVEFLLDRGADLETKNTHGETCLHQAKGPQMAKLLLDRGANVHAADSYGRTALHVAAYYGRGAEIVEQLLDRGANVNQRDRRGETPLHRTTDRAVTTLLLDRGANVDAKDEKGRTPLHHAVLHCKIEQVLHLLKRGANVNAKDRSGRTALLLLPIPIPDSEPPLVLHLLEKGANMYAVDCQGKTFVHRIVLEDEQWFCHISRILELLLNRNFDLEVRDNREMTPLLCAAELGNAKFVHLLLDKGSTVDSSGLNLLYYAANSGNKQLVRSLLLRGAVTQYF